MNLPKSATSDEITRQIIIDSNSLLQKTAKLQEEASKVPILEQKVAELTQQKTASELKLAELRRSFAEKVAEFADRLIQHGSLDSNKKAAFVETVQSDASQFVGVMEKLAGSSVAGQFGGGDDTKSLEAEKVDPIARFCST